MLNFPAAPNLPLAGNEYESRYQDQLNNTLRLYFTRLSGGLLALSGQRGGAFLEFPFGEFQNNTTIAVAAANTPTRIPLPITDFANGMFVEPGNGIHVDQSGVYNLQFSVQFRNTDTQTHNVYIWLRVTGVDVPSTTSAYSVPSKHGGGDGYTIGAANFYVQLMEGEYVELWWAADNVAVSLFAIPAQTTPYPRPLSPSAVATLSFVSTV